MSSSYSLGQPLDICRSDTPLDLCFMVRRQDCHLPKSCLAVKKSKEEKFHIIISFNFKFIPSSLYKTLLPKQIYIV